MVYHICPEFQITEQNKKVLNAIYDYTNGSGILNPRKGVLLFGDIGTGKSTMLKILAEFQRLYGEGFLIVNTSKLAAEYTTDGMEALNESTWNKSFRGTNPVTRGFDELGRELIPAKYYGSELNIMQHILQIRYDLKAKTHATTNLNIEELEQKYGSHIYDRMLETFNFIEMKGESFRK